MYGQCSVVNSRREERGEQRAQGKRQLEEDGEEGGEGEMEVVEEGGGRGPKRAREEGSSEGGGANGERRSGGMPDLNFPLPDATGLPCLLKVNVFLRGLVIEAKLQQRCLANVLTILHVLRNIGWWGIKYPRTFYPVCAHDNIQGIKTVKLDFRNGILYRCMVRVWRCFV